MIFGFMRVIGVVINGLQNLRDRRLVQNVDPPIGINHSLENQLVSQVRKREKIRHDILFLCYS